MHWQLLHIHWKKVTNQVNYQCTVKSGQTLYVPLEDGQTLAQLSSAAFLFLYFLKTFFTEIYFRFHILQFYTRPAGAAETYI